MRSFLRRRSSVVGDQIRRVDAPDAAALPQLRRGLVVAHHADQGNRRAERREVHGDVGGPAGTIVVVVVLDDRDRRFGRQSLHATEQEVVQHHVADDDDTASGESCISDRARA